MAASRNAKHAFNEAERLRKKDGKARKKKEMEGEPHAHEYINWKINGRIIFYI